MALPTVVVDTGPIVALLDADEAHHDWARRQFDMLAAPLLTCEAVLSEASFLLQRSGADPSLPVRFVERGVLRIVRLLNSSDDAAAIGRLMRRYHDVPMSFADACLVRLVERTDHASIMTLDSDFHIYRQARRRVIPLLTPA
ncbi:MAG: PIN domain-containing protein [Thiotrichales bacterium]|nr:PIN domain-containing protein [Thiotrichales bacterium]